MRTSKIIVAEQAIPGITSGTAMEAGGAALCEALGVVGGGAGILGLGLDYVWVNSPDNPVREGGNRYSR